MIRLPLMKTRVKKNISFHPVFLFPHQDKPSMLWLPTLTWKTHWSDSYSTLQEDHRDRGGPATCQSWVWPKEIRTERKIQLSALIFFDLLKTSYHMTVSVPVNKPKEKFCSSDWMIYYSNYSLSNFKLIYKLQLLCSFYHWFALV